MKTDRLRTACEQAYMLAVCFFLLWDIPYMTEAQWTFDLRGWFPAAWYGLAACALVLTRMQLGAGWFPAGLLVWMTAASAYRGAAVLDAQMADIARGVLAFMVILPAPGAVSVRRMERYLTFLLAAWTACLTAQAAIGLWAALTGHAVFSLKGTWYIGVNLGDNRLYLNAYVTTGAVKLGLSVLMAALGAAFSRKRMGKMLYALCALIQLACLSLTDCRTAFIAVGAALGLMAGMLLHHGLKRRGVCGLCRRCAWLAVPVMTAAVYLALAGALTAFAPHVPRELDNITMLELPAHLLPDAAAEDAVQHRTLDAGNLFNDRQIIWRASLRLLKEKPEFLFTGTTTTLSPMLTNAAILPQEHTGRAFVHVHSIYLQTLISWGLPGFVLLMSLLAAFLLAARRVLLRHALPMWQRLLPVPVLYVLVCDTVDCFTRLAEGAPMLLFACFFAGMTMAVDARARYQAYAKARPEARVDVIIPVFNAAGYLARAVRSALANGAARVILVDDGSTDGSGAICDALARQDMRIAVLHQENRGASAARNAGLAAAVAEYVAFLDADDMLAPGALAALTERVGGADAIQGRIVRTISDHIPQAGAVRMPAQAALSAALSDPTRRLLCHGWLFRRELLTECFDERLTMGEDGEWLLRTLLRAKEAAFCEVPAYCYTVRAESALHGGHGDVKQAYMETLSAAAPALEKADAPVAAALYQLTHLLLILTHGDLGDMRALRDASPFDGAFRQARLRGLSGRMATLRLLRRRRYALAGAAVRLRRLRNHLSCRKPPETYGDG